MNRGDFRRGFDALLRRHPLPALDRTAIERAEVDDALRVRLPHANGTWWVEVYVEDEEISVSWPDEHAHFRPRDPAEGWTWPIDAPDFVTASLAFVEALLTGRVETEVRKGWLWVHTRSWLVDEDGDCQLFLTGATLWPTFRRSGPEVHRMDFASAPTTARPPRTG